MPHEPRVLPVVLVLLAVPLAASFGVGQQADDDRTDELATDTTHVTEFRFDAGADPSTRASDDRCCSRASAAPPPRTWSSSSRKPLRADDGVPIVLGLINLIARSI